MRVNRRGAVGLVSAAAGGLAAALLRPGRASATRVTPNARGERVFGVFDVKDFGARGNGLQDDARAIQAAIDAASVRGGTVLLPPGEYAVGRTLELRSNVHLMGSGPNATVLRLPNGAAQRQVPAASGRVPRVSLAVLELYAVRGVTISGLRIDGNKQGNGYLGLRETFTGGPLFQGGIFLSGRNVYSSARVPVSDCLVENCVLENCVMDGFAALGAVRCIVRDTTANDNGIVNPDRSVPYGPNGITFSDYCEDCIIERCIAFRNPHGGLEFYGRATLRGIIRDCHSDSVIVNTTESTEPAVGTCVVGCVIDNREVFPRLGNAGPCIVVTTAAGVDVRNNRCVVGYNSGIGAGWRGEEPRADREHNATGISISGNHIEYASAGTRGPYAGINVADWNEGLIHGNIIRGDFAYGVRVLKSRGVSIADNVIVRGNAWHPLSGNASAGRGIHLHGCYETVVRGNTIRGFDIAIHEERYALRDLPPLESDFNVISSNVLRNNRAAFGSTPGPHSITVDNVTPLITAPAQRNRRGRVRLVGGQSSVAVRFQVPEPDADFYITATVSAVSCDVPVAARFAFVSNRTPEGFRVHLGEAPDRRRGVGWVDVDWHLER